MKRKEDENVGTVHDYTELHPNVFSEIKNLSLLGCELMDILMHNIHCTIVLYYTKHYETTVTRN
jgi:hypothetical protein